MLFTDIDLGEGMDGATLARLAREMRPQLPVVYASGRRSVEQLDTVPGSVFLPKPYVFAQPGRRDCCAAIASVPSTIADLACSIPPPARNCSSQWMW